MKFGQREKIFVCALLAVSVFFLLFDQIYLVSKKNHSLEQIQQSESASSTNRPILTKKQILDEYDEAKSAMITYALISLAVGFFYAFWISKKRDD